MRGGECNRTSPDPPWIFGKRPMTGCRRKRSRKLPYVAWSALVRRAGLGGGVLAITTLASPVVVLLFLVTGHRHPERKVSRPTWLTNLEGVTVIERNTSGIP